SGRLRVRARGMLAVVTGVLTRALNGDGSECRETFAATAFAGDAGDFLIADRTASFLRLNGRGGFWRRGGCFRRRWLGRCGRRRRGPGLNRGGGRLRLDRFGRR